eukprot:XP_016664743.1 PREDICTED: uncharacterized protein LOC100572255 [Acyrthosiphon pisum]
MVIEVFHLSADWKTLSAAFTGGQLTNLRPRVIYDVSKVKFTTDCPAQGNRNYIPVSDLYGRNFTDANGEFQLELSIGHVRTVYDTEFGVPTSLTSRLLHHHHQIQNHHNPAAGNALQHQYGTASPRGTKCKLETSYFTFGGFDWNLALYPHGVKDVSCTSVEGRMSVYLNRCTGFDHQCRVRYMLVLGDGEKRLDSGILDDVSDSDGKSYGWHPRYKFSELVTKVCTVTFFITQLFLSQLNLVQLMTGFSYSQQTCVFLKQVRVDSFGGFQTNNNENKD